MSYVKSVLKLAGLVVVAAVGAGYAAAPADERPPSFKATALLTPAQVRGPHHQVADTVTTPDYFHEFTIVSDFGGFEAEGRTMLAVRLHEIDALAQLQGVSKTDVFLQAAGNVGGERREGRGGCRHQPGGHCEGPRFGDQALRHEPRARRLSAPRFERGPGGRWRRAAATPRPPPRPKGCWASTAPRAGGRRSSASIPTRPTRRFTRRWRTSAKWTRPARSSRKSCFRSRRWSA